jgi:hypothetical protein
LFFSCIFSVFLDRFCGCVRAKFHGRLGLWLMSVGNWLLWGSSIYVFYVIYNYI